MILIFGPAGSGKSLQGQILAARFNWAWLSMGQLLREENDPKLTKIMDAGDLVPAEVTNQIADKAAKKAAKTHPQVIMDGYPRSEDQAIAMLTNNWPLNVAISLEVPYRELLKRMLLRARPDDTKDAIKERLAIYHRNNTKLMAILSKNGVKVVKVNGVGTVGQVHDRIMKVLVKCKLV
ncbi:nucleoside monophosphate kinase [Candidatus Saccharibacteria bacterium]|nr:nucleoside monophosphate kinase [Candidatus Saccharibacteria bacterium]